MGKDGDSITMEKACGLAPGVIFDVVGACGGIERELVATVCVATVVDGGDLTAALV
jgi:hypothetical protein